jgi:spore maturation protein CgeB
VLLAGLGLGYHLERLLERLPADIPVWVFEPDPLWIYLTLSRIDLSGPIRQGRLHIAEGLALLELVAAVPAGAVIVAHPGLEPRLRWEVSTLRRSLAARDRDAEGREAEGLSGGSDGVDGGREPPPVTGQRASDRSELTPLRVCLVEGELFFEDLAEAFRQRGDALAVLHPARLSPEEILEELARARPDLVLSVNQVEGLAELCAQARVPYVVWEIDPRMWVVQPPAPVARPWVHTFTYRRKHVARYLEAGFPFVEHLPLAATPAFRMPVALDDDLRRRYGAPVSFVGSSLVLDNLRDQQRAEEALRAKLQACTTPGERERWTRALQVLRDALRAQQSDLMRPVLIEMLEAGWAALGLVPELEVEGRRIDLRIVYARMFGTRRRALVVSSLARHGVAVYGDQAWREVLGPGCEYRGPADHGLELTRIYNASILNLDIGRLYQLDIVTMRVFDILACGAFPLVERSEELDELLAPGLEVVSWSDLAGLDEAAAYYLHHPGERLRLVEAGRARVLRDHTVARRVETMIERLRARGVLPRAAGNSGLA